MNRKYSIPKTIIFYLNLHSNLHVYFWIIIIGYATNFRDTIFLKFHLLRNVLSLAACKWVCNKTINFVRCVWLTPLRQYRISWKLQWFLFNAYTKTYLIFTILYASFLLNKNDFKEIFISYVGLFYDF